MSASAGRVMMIPRGDYSASQTYNILDVVSYNGSSYVAKRTTVGNAPTDTTYWQSLADMSAKMDKSVYDSNNNGVVDNAERVNNHTVEKDVPGDAQFTDTKTLADLTDTDINNPADGETLVYNAATGKFKNATGGASTVDLTSDVTGILPIANGGTGNSSGFISAGKKVGTTVGANATAEGYDTTASGSYSHAEGSGTKAFGSASHAEGINTNATGLYSHAEGEACVATGTRSHAGGAGVTASKKCAFVHGNWSDTKSIGGINANGFTFGLDCSTTNLTSSKTIDATGGACGVITGNSAIATLTLDKAAIYLLVVNEIATWKSIGGSAAYLVSASASDTTAASLVALGTNGTAPTVSTVSDANQITIKKAGTNVNTQFNLIRVA